MSFTQIELSAKVPYYYTISLIRSYLVSIWLVGFFSSLFIFNQPHRYRWWLEWTLGIFITWMYYRMYYRVLLAWFGRFLGHIRKFCRFTMLHVNLICVLHVALTVLGVPMFACMFGFSGVVAPWLGFGSDVCRLVEVLACRFATVVGFQNSCRRGCRFRLGLSVIDAVFRCCGATFQSWYSRSILLVVLSTGRQIGGFV